MDEVGLAARGSEPQRVQWVAAVCEQGERCSVRVCCGSEPRAGDFAYKRVVSLTTRAGRLAFGSSAEYDAPMPIRPTTIIEAPRLASRLGIDLFVASETFQHTGSFKFRAAWNLTSKVPQMRIITASSGNFGQALACACGLLGKSATVVMPDTSAQVKVDAVREYGGKADLIDVRKTSRQRRIQELAQEDSGSYVASPYDDPLVIEGNATLGAELAALNRRIDFVLAPVGGGGLTSGLIQGLRTGQKPKATQVVGVEPEAANDAARSLAAGRIIANDTEPQTIADGVRTVSLGQLNWQILQGGLAGIIEVTEEQIMEAVRLLFNLANLKVEPTGALAVAALLAAPERFRGRSVCCVASGGNVDPAVFRSFLSICAQMPV